MLDFKIINCIKNLKIFKESKLYNDQLIKNVRRPKMIFYNS